MEALDKNGTVIHTEITTVSHTQFIEEVIKPFKVIMAGVESGKPPFEYIYVTVSKKEIINTVRQYKTEVSYSIMFNSIVQPELKDILYIHRMRMTLLDKI